jgi:hypothetical protein
MDCISKCLVELRAKREQLDEAIVALERFSSGTVGRRRGRPPEWLRAATQGDSAAVLQPKAVESKSKEPHKKPRKRKISPEGKLAIRLGVALRHWKAAHPEAGEEDVAKQRERIRQQLQRRAS